MLRDIILTITNYKIENYTNTYFLNDLVVTNELEDMQGTIIRPSNLEDLFLHITGHQLRE